MHPAWSCVPAGVSLLTGKLTGNVAIDDDGDGDVGKREGAANVTLIFPSPPPAYHDITKNHRRIGENEFGRAAPGTSCAGNPRFCLLFL